MSNNWLDSEIDELQSEIRLHKNDRLHKWIAIKHERAVMLKILIFCGVFFCYFGIFLTANPVIQNQKTLPAKTWKCKKCGYENYDGIWTCPCCGTSR